MGLIMAGNIKGITIEFKGDTTSLSSALKKIRNETNSTQRSLREVDRALKFNPRNVELLTQKQRLLKDRVQETANKVKELKNIQKQMDARGVEKTSAEYQKLRREILIAENQQKHFTKEMLRFGNAKFNAVASGLTNVGNKLTTINRRARQVVGSLAALALYKGFERLKTLDEVSTELGKLGYEGEKLDTVMEAATESVSGTKFALTDMAKVMKGALGSGVSDAYDLGEYLQRTADLAQLAGIDVQKMGAMMNKAYSKGKVDARLLNQLNANGIPIYKLLQDELGVSADELAKMTSAGKVGFDDLYKATEKYQGLAQEMGTETFSGAFTVLTQQFGLIGAEFLQGAYEPLKEGVKGIVATIKELRSTGQFKQWGEDFVNFMKPVVGFVKELITAAAGLPTPIKQFGVFFALFGGPTLKAVGALTKKLGQLYDGAKNAGTTLATLSKGDAVAGAFGIIAANIGLAALGIHDLITGTNDYTRAYERNKQAREGEIADINATYGAASSYAAKLDELVNKENKSAEDKANIKTYVDLLNGSIEGLNLTYDEEADRLNKTTNEIYKSIDAMKQQALAAAYKEQMAEASKELVQAETDLADEQKRLTNYQKLYNEAVKTGNSSGIKQFGEEINRSNKKIQGYNKVIRSSKTEIDKYANGYKNATQKVGSETSKMEKTAKNNLDKMVSGAKTSGEKFSSNVGSGIRSNKSKASSASKSVSDSVENNFSPKSYSLGKSWTQGIANGISGAVNLVANAVDIVTKKMEDEYSSNTKTHSPSRVATKLGGYWTEGMAIGMKENLAMIRAASADLSRAVVGGGTVNNNETNKNLNANYTIIVNGSGDPEAYGRYLAEGLKQGMRTI